MQQEKMPARPSSNGIKAAAPADVTPALEFDLDEIPEAAPEAAARPIIVLPPLPTPALPAVAPNPSSGRRRRRRVHFSGMNETPVMPVFTFPPSPQPMDFIEKMLPPLRPPTPEDDYFEAGEMPPAVPWKLLKESKVVLTKERAAYVLAMPHMRYERNIASRHLEKLLKVMRRGHFREEGTEIAICYFNGVWYELNGRHTCTDRQWMPHGWSPTIYIRQYEAPDIEVMKDLYGTFDPQFASRDRRHQIKIQLPEAIRAKLPVSEHEKLVTMGFEFWHWDHGDARSGADSHDVTEAISANEELYFEVAHFMQDHVKTSYVKRAPVVAAIFECVAAAPDRYLDFWAPVAHGLWFGEEHGTSEIRLMMHRWLRNHSITAGKAGRTQDAGGDLAEEKKAPNRKTSVSQEDAYRQCVQTWNRWAAGDRTADQLRIPNYRPRANAPKPYVPNPDNDPLIVSGPTARDWPKEKEYHWYDPFALRPRGAL